MSKYERTIDQAEIDTEAARLRVRGLTYQQIATQQGCNASSAYQRVQRAIAAVPVEAVEELRAVEVERLDILLKVAMDSVLVDGKLYNIDRCLAIGERRAKLLGIDAPTRTTLTVVTEDATTAAIRALEIELGLQFEGGSLDAVPATAEGSPET